MPGKASKLVAAAKEWATHYGDYTLGDEADAFTAPLRAKGAWDRNDADGFADVFVDNGSMLVGDEQLTSREAIRAYVKSVFDGELAGTTLAVQPLEVKLLTPEVAFIVTEGGVVPAGRAEPASDERTRSTWVAVKRDGAWHLVSQQSSPVKG